jgi:hypothetical protein
VVGQKGGGKRWVCIWDGNDREPSARVSALRASNLAGIVYRGLTAPGYQKCWPIRAGVMDANGAAGGAKAIACNEHTRRAGQTHLTRFQWDNSIGHEEELGFGEFFTPTAGRMPALRSNAFALTRREAGGRHARQVGGKFVNYLPKERG